jgi:hypothetical protein
LPESFECPNCGATSQRSTQKCARCGLNLGGLLKLYDAAVRHVRHVGWGPAGAFGLDAAGKLVWIADWGYMTSVEVLGAQLRLGGKAAELETGKLLPTDPGSVTA